MMVVTAPDGTLLLTLAEACKLTGRCDKVLRAEMKAWRLRYIVLGRTKYLTRDDIDEWIRSKREEWESAKISSAEAQTPRSGTRTSPSMVLGFAEARAKRMKPQPGSKPPRR